MVTKKALAAVSVPDDLAVFDFDNAANLLRIGMRPSEVVIRNRSARQRRAAQLFDETNADGSRAWHGLQWWSYHHPQWANLMLWSTPTTPAPITVEEVADLTLKSPAVIDAAKALCRSLE